MFRMTVRISALWLAMSFSSIAGASTIYVDASVVSSGDGTSWSQAKKTLGEAMILARRRDEVWVASATYTESISLKNGVKIYGGFDGTETSASQSDPVANPTYISGGGTARCITSVNNMWTTVVRGLYIVDGNTTFPGSGGGAYLSNSNAKFVDCVFAGNTSSVFGGAVHTETGSPTFVNCTFYDNGLLAGGAVIWGCGAVFNRDFGAPTFINCLFYENKAMEGGAVCNFSGAATFINCTITDNTATVATAGALFDNRGEAVFRNCILWNNSAVVAGTEEIYNSAVIGNTTTVSYSDVTGGWMGTGNIDADPKFVSPALDNYKLTASWIDPSPCKDVGNNADVPDDVGDLDWDGNVAESIPFDLTSFIARILYSTVDMGAYEVSQGF